MSTDPKGRPWQDTTIRGHPSRRTVILRNDLYVGRLVWNKQHYVKDPTTGRRLARPNPEDQWIIEEVPHLRIVDDVLWHRVQERLDGIRSSAPVRKARKTRFWEHRRARHLLTGLLHCSTCGSPLVSVGKDYLACGRARRTGTCDNTRGIRRQNIEEAVLDCLKKNLMQPDLVEEFIRAFHSEVNKQQSVLEHDLAGKKRQLAKLDHRLFGLYDAIADGLRTPGLKAKLEEMEAQKAVLQDEIDAAPPPDPRLHPNLAELFWTRNRNSIESLRKDLPWLRTNKGEHYADILEALYKLRREKPSKHSKAKATERKVNNTATAVDKSLLAISTSKRVRDKEHLRYVASQPCLVCGRNPCQSHHIRFAQPRAMGRKVSDEWVVPLCVTHHRSLHDVGDEERWWKQNGSIDPILEAERLWKQTRDAKFRKTSKELRGIRQATN